MSHKRSKSNRRVAMFRAVASGMVSGETRAERRRAAALAIKLIIHSWMTRRA